MELWIVTQLKNLLKTKQCYQFLPITYMWDKGASVSEVSSLSKDKAGLESLVEDIS